MTCRLTLKGGTGGEGDQGWGWGGGRGGGESFLLRAVEHAGTMLQRALSHTHTLTKSLCLTKIHSCDHSFYSWNSEAKRRNQERHKLMTSTTPLLSTSSVRNNPGPSTLAAVASWRLIPGTKEALLPSKLDAAMPALSPDARCMLLRRRFTSAHAASTSPMLRRPSPFASTRRNILEMSRGRCSKTPVICAWCVCA
jgi:hypothetical protein